jgi:hypothetical protein
MKKDWCGRTQKLERVREAGKPAWHLLSAAGQQEYVAKVLVPLLAHPLDNIRGMALFALQQLAKPPALGRWGVVEVVPATATCAGGGSNAAVDSNHGTALAACLPDVAAKAVALVLDSDWTTQEGEKFAKVALRLLVRMIHNGPLLSAATAIATGAELGEVSGSEDFKTFKKQELLLPHLHRLVSELVGRAVAGIAVPSGYSSSSSSQGIVSKACKGAQALTMLTKVKEAMENAGFPKPGKREVEEAAVTAVHAAAVTSAASPGMADPSGKSTPFPVQPKPQQQQQQILAAMEEWHALHGAAAAAFVAAAKESLLPHQHQVVGNAAAVAAAQGSLVAPGSTGLPALIRFRVGELCNELALLATNWRDLASIRLLLQQRVLPGLTAVCKKPNTETSSSSEAQDQAAEAAAAIRFGGAALTGAVLPGSSFKGFWEKRGSGSTEGDLIRCWW